jgi:hypothetical protein
MVEHTNQRPATGNNPGAWTIAGLWIWGTILTVMFGVIVVAFVAASLHVTDDGKWTDTEHGFWSGIYAVVKANQTVAAALVATLGVVWSWFFQMAYGRSDQRGANVTPTILLVNEANEVIRIVRG